jgi:capsular polysaccharide biosynthesis protein
MRKLLKKNILIKRKLPVNFSSNDASIFSNELERQMPNLYSNSYKNICVNSDQYLWKKFNFLAETFFRREKRKEEFVSNLKYLIKSFFKKKTKIKNGLWLIDNWSHGYFHWFGDVLQKYQALKNHDSILLLPYYYSNLDYVILSSKYLNIKLLFIKEKEIIKCKKFTIIPTTFISGNFFENLVSTYATKLQNSISNPLFKDKILYLSREQTNRRKVENEFEIINCVKSFGGKILKLEKLTWIEQLSYFKNCEVLISPHGAGLINMIFCSNRSKIIELRHLNSTNQNMYFSLSSSLGLDYYYILCKGKDADPHSSNITVPVKELKSLLKSLNK